MPYLRAARRCCYGDGQRQCSHWLMPPPIADDFSDYAYDERIDADATPPLMPFSLLTLPLIFIHAYFHLRWYFFFFFQILLLMPAAATMLSRMPRRFYALMPMIFSLMPRFASLIAMPFHYFLIFTFFFFFFPFTCHYALFHYAIYMLYFHLISFIYLYLCHADYLRAAMPYWYFILSCTVAVFSLMSFLLADVFCCFSFLHHLISFTCFEMLFSLMRLITFSFIIMLYLLMLYFIITGASSFDYIFFDIIIYFHAIDYADYAYYFDACHLMLIYAIYMLISLFSIDGAPPFMPFMLSHFIWLRHFSWYLLRFTWYFIDAYWLFFIAFIYFISFTIFIYALITISAMLPALFTLRFYADDARSYCFSCFGHWLIFYALMLAMAIFITTFSLDYIDIITFISLIIILFSLCFLPFSFHFIYFIFRDAISFISCRAAISLWCFLPCYFQPLLLIFLIYFMPLPRIFHYCWYFLYFLAYLFVIDMFHLRFAYAARCHYAPCRRQLSLTPAPCSPCQTLQLIYLIIAIALMIIYSVIFHFHWLPDFIAAAFDYLPYAVSRYAHAAIWCCQFAHADYFRFFAAMPLFISDATYCFIFLFFFFFALLFRFRY